MGRCQVSVFSISEQFHDGCAAVLAVGGEIDCTASPHLRRAIGGRIDAGARQLLVDLSAVTFIDSSAIGVLVTAATRLREAAGGSLQVVCCEDNRRVRRILDVAGVAGTIAVHSRREHALAPPRPFEPCATQPADWCAPGSRAGAQTTRSAAAKTYAGQAAAGAARAEQTLPREPSPALDQLA
jgi:anti-sigma B factor antagonist